MGIVFFGTPQFAVPTFEALKDEIILVITQPDKPAGRGRRLTASPVKKLALEYGIELLQPESLKEPTVLERIFEKKPEFAVVVAYGKIIPEEIINRLNCINLHASLLPKYRGAAPIQWALINGEKTTGITTMLLDAGLDTGPILLQKKIPIQEEDTAETLSRKLAEEGADLMVKTLKGLRDGSIKPKPQQGEPSYAPMLKKSDGLIDWTQPALKIHNLVRGLYPWPTAYTYVNGKLIKILKTKPLEGKAQAGYIVQRTKKSLIVGTGDGLLEILEIQPEGKRPQPIEAFLQGAGKNLKEGDRLR